MSINQLRGLKIIDLSPPLSKQTPNWPMCWFEWIQSHHHNEDGLAITQIKFSAHVGTHVDGPFHIYPKGKGDSPYKKAYEIPLEDLRGEAVCLDIPKGQKEQISIRDLENAETKVPLGIKKKDIVMINSGWWRNNNNKQLEQVFLYKYPWIAVEACKWLVNRSIKLFCCDMPCVDDPDTKEEEDKWYPSHRTFFRNNIPLIENHVNLDAIKNKRFLYMALPLSFTEIPDGIPCRSIALI